MPPKPQPNRSAVGLSNGGRQAQQQGYARQVLNGLADPENRGVVLSVGFFAAGVAFLHSSWSEVLLPPL